MINPIHSYSEQFKIPTDDFDTFQSLERQSKFGSMFFYVVDTVTMEITYLSGAETFTGFSTEKLKKSGAEFLFEMIQPRDHDRMRRVRALEVSWFTELPMYMRTACEFSFNFMMLCRKGETKMALHKTYFPKIDARGEALLAVGIIYDITAYRGDTSMILTMRGFDPVQRKELLKEEIFQSATQAMRLTERQLEILVLIKAGKTTAQIANEMSISKETVKGHRKKMLAVTRSRSMPELIHKVSNQKLV